MRTAFLMMKIKLMQHLHTRGIKPLPKYSNTRVTGSSIEYLQFILKMNILKHFVVFYSRFHIKLTLFKN